uniref:Uncharacterized protein n=1 Tax=Anguilla anguilla TaxID=7936 RepID=A0A0E9SWV5_ANGAN
MLRWELNYPMLSVCSH